MVNARRLVFEQAHKPAQPALVPDKVWLTPPGGPLLLTITGDSLSSYVYLTRDQKRIISLSGKNTLKIFDARDGHLIGRGTEGVGCMTNHFLVNITEEYGVTSGHGGFEVWNINTGQQLHDVHFSKYVCSIGLINDDIVAIIEGEVQVYNFRTGKSVQSFRDPRLVQKQILDSFSKRRFFFNTDAGRIEPL